MSPFFFFYQFVVTFIVDHLSSSYHSTQLIISLLSLFLPLLKLMGEKMQSMLQRNGKSLCYSFAYDCSVDKVLTLQTPS